MKSVHTRVIGIGQPVAGDDGAGIAVIRALRGRGVPAGVELHEIDDPSALIGLLDDARRVILVDALACNDRPGTIRQLAPAELATQAASPCSSHGLGVAEAIALAGRLAPATVSDDIRIIGIAIRPADHYTTTLSAPVRDALPGVTRQILDLLVGR